MHTDHYEVDDYTYYVVTVDRYTNITAILHQCIGWDAAQAIIDRDYAGRGNVVIADQPHVDLYLNPEED